MEEFQLRIFGNLAIAFAVSVAASAASASETTIPAAFHGVWQPAEPGTAPTCLPRDADTRQTISAERIDFHEGICWPTAISVADAQSLRIDARCEQEDSSWESQQEWRIGESNGRRRLSINSLDPAQPYKGNLGLCSGAASNGAAVSSSRPNALPFPDGRYVTDKALCGLSEQQMLERHGDMLGAMVRVIDGPRLTNAYEMQCTVGDVRVAGDDVRFRAKCGREGKADTVNGRYVRLSSTSFRLGQRTFSLCGTDAASPQTASICYRDGMSKLDIIKKDGGSYEIGLMAAMPNKSICGIGGPVTKTSNGYLYSERLEDGGQCQLSIIVDADGGVTFADPDWNCKRHNCGARAYFEHIEFSPATRVSCN